MNLQSKTNSTELSVLASESGWNNLYTLAGVAAVILLFYSLVTMVLLIVIGGQPESVEEGFRMLQENRFVGLLRLDVLTIFVMPLYYLLFVVFYAALRKTDPGYTFLALILGCAGLTLVLATPSAMSFLALSDKFAAETSEASRTLLMAAGEAILASDLWHGSGALVGGLLTQAGMLLFSLLLLRANVFSKVTAWVGVVTHSLDLLHILVGPVVPAGSTVLLMIAGPLYLLWFPLLARDFFRLGRRTLRTE